MSDANLQRAPQWDADPIDYSENQATSPGEETTQKPKIKPRRHAIACISCRKRKMRCDGTQPRCNACVVRSVPCEYKTIDRRAGTKKGYIAVLGSKLSQSSVSFNLVADCGMGELTGEHRRARGAAKGGRKLA